MYEEAKQITEEIRAHDLAIGVLAYECIESANDQRYMASLACLFVLAEQSVKLANQVSEGNFKQQISNLVDNRTITKDEGLLLNNLRGIRNTLFHENHYMYAVVSDDGKATFLGEHDAKEALWEKFSVPVLNICLRIITHNSSELG